MSRGKKILMSLGGLLLFAGAAAGAGAVIVFTEFGTTLFGTGQTVSEQDQKQASNQAILEIEKQKELQHQEQLQVLDAEGAELTGKIAQQDERLRDLDKREAQVKGRTDDKRNLLIAKLQERLKEEQTRLASSKRLEEFAKKTATEVTQLRETIASLTPILGALERVEDSLARETFLLTQQAREVEMAKLYNSSFFKELALYLFGFKWFWGLFTGYANTNSSSKAELELEKAKALFDRREKELTTEISELKTKFDGAVELAFTRLELLAKQLGRLTPALEEQLLNEFLNPLRHLIANFKYKREQLTYAVKAYSARFTAGLDSNLYFSREAASQANQTPLSPPEPLAKLENSLNSVKSEVDQAKRALEELKSRLFIFLSEVSLNHFDLRKIGFVVGVTEQKVIEITRRIAELRRAE